MYFSNNVSEKKKKVKTSKSEINRAKDLGIDLSNSWNAYSREVRLHVYVSNMDNMTRFYNKILEFPVVKYWRHSDGDGTMISIGGNIVELFSKNKRNFSNKNYYGNISFSNRVRDVHKLHDKFSRKNIEISELEENKWGDTSFSVVDPEGNRLVFFSPHISKEKYYRVEKG